MEENLTAIEQIHNDVFEFLLEKHFEEKKKGNDFFFKTRQRFKGKEKLWFLGNNDYAAISFWTGTDYQHKTPNIYLNIHIDGTVALFVVGKADEEQRRFLSFLANETSEYQILNLNTSDNEVWIKKYTDNHNGQYLKYLKEFLDTDKKIIDKYVSVQENLNNFLNGVITTTTTASIIDNDSNQQDEEAEYSETYIES